MNSDLVVAVYGTLKKGFNNHPLMSGARFICNAVTADDNYTMTVYPGGLFPIVAMSKSRDAGKVAVEIYEVDKETLDTLDVLEGHPEFYRREKVTFTSDKDGQLIIAWMYMFPPDSIIPNTLLKKNGVYRWEI